MGEGPRSGHFSQDQNIIIGPRNNIIEHWKYFLLLHFIEINSGFLKCLNTEVSSNKAERFFIKIITLTKTKQKENINSKVIGLPSCITVFFFHYSNEFINKMINY